MVDSRNPGLAHRLEYMAQERFAPELRKNIRVKADADRIVEIHVGDSVATLRPHHPGNSFERLASRFDWAAQLVCPRLWDVRRGNTHRYTTMDHGVEVMIENMVQQEALWMAAEVAPELAITVGEALDARVAKLVPNS